MDMRSKEGVYNFGGRCNVLSENNHTICVILVTKYVQTREIS
jgi:hypothetical protein